MSIASLMESPIEGDKVSLKVGENSIVLPPAKAKKLIDGRYNGKTVVIGIRPEDVDDAPAALEAHKDSVFNTKVTGYELLGSEVLLYYTVNGTSMTAKVSSSTPARLGDSIKLAMDINAMHVFDKETELTISGTPYRLRFCTLHPGSSSEVIR